MLDYINTLTPNKGQWRKPPRFLELEQNVGRQNV